MLEIDLNADLGEGTNVQVDEALLDQATSANIACGGHAGDEQSMRWAVRAAAKRGVRIGAHPSYPERDNFGRRSMPINRSDLEASLSAQIRALIDIATGEGDLVQYVKPHGALYNDAANSEGTAEVIFRAADHYALRVMALAGSPMAAMHPDKVIKEGFIDRGYASDGTLIPRTDPDALITDPEVAATQALRLAPRVDSLCVHSDTPHALVILLAARKALIREGYTISAK